MNMTDPLNLLGSIWCYLEPLEVPDFPDQFLGWDFFAVSFSKPALITSQDFASISAKNWTPLPLAIQVPPALISTLTMHAFLGDLYRGVSRIISILGEQHDAWMLEAS